MKETTSHTSPLISPGGRVLLHACCAPCSGAVMEILAASAIEYAIFFYNPNIHPEAEYRKRKHEITRYADKCGVPVIDADYDPGKWFSRAKGMEAEPERGRRCTVCFTMRLERAARYANENGYSILATTLGISRWKNLDQVNACGRNAVSGYATVTYWDCNWRKQGGAMRMMEIAKGEGFYRQNYCGCVYSLRDAERRRSSRQCLISPEVTNLVLHK